MNFLFTIVAGQGSLDALEQIKSKIGNLYDEDGSSFFVRTDFTKYEIQNGKQSPCITLLLSHKGVVERIGWNSFWRDAAHSSGWYSKYLHVQYIIDIRPGGNAEALCHLYSMLGVTGAANHARVMRLKPNPKTIQPLPLP